MKGFVGVTQEKDSCLIGLLPMDIGGQEYVKKCDQCQRFALNIH